MIKVVNSGDLAEDIRRLRHSVNFSEMDLPFPAIGSDEALASVTGLVLYGGLAVDRSVFRRLLPDAQWAAYAAGFASTDDANTVTLGLYYQLDNGTTVLLGSTTHTGGFTKKAIGPFDVFGTGGVPTTETIPMVRFGATKNVAGNAHLQNWVVWLRFLPSKQ